jgi:F-type H+-transporting ATPase subunit epsilon
MSKLTLEIVTPERAVFDEAVDEVILPGTDGELGILPGHLPMMTTLKSGRLIAVNGGEQRRFAVHGGFAEILPDKVIILTDASEDASAIDIARARAALERAEQAMREVEARGAEVEAPDAAEAHKRSLERARARLLVSEDK